MIFSTATYAVHTSRKKNAAQRWRNDATQARGKITTPIRERRGGGANALY